MATAEQRAALALHSARELAAAAGVSRPTALAAKAGEPVRPICLGALLDAAARLAAHAPTAAGPGREKCARPGKCLHCSTGDVFRRDVCRTCHRKLSAAGIALPARHASGRAPRTQVARVRAWVRSLAPGHRELLRRALEAA